MICHNISKVQRRRAIVRWASAITLGLAGLAAVAPPALALPGLALDADLYGGLCQGAGLSAKPGNVDLDLYVGAPGFKASVHAFGLGSAGDVAEGVLRWQLPLAIIAIRPGIGFQADTLFAGLKEGIGQAGPMSGGPYGNLWVTIEPPLSPVTADVAVGASYPLNLEVPVVDYLADVDFFPVPALPVGLSVRYRGYTVDTMGTPALSTIELGLRIKL